MSEYVPLLFDEDEIIEREEAINNIHQEMLDINEIFKTLATLSEQQGYLIDNIETNIDNTVVNIEHATGELITADNTQKKRNKCLWYILFILLIIVIIVTLVLVLTLK
jgi:t-SNARE complex subunit (syntaxin)